jgi:hypothetical protein
VGAAPIQFTSAAAAVVVTIKVDFIMEASTPEGADPTMEASQEMETVRRGDSTTPRTLSVIAVTP